MIGSSSQFVLGELHVWTLDKNVVLLGENMAHHGVVIGFSATPPPPPPELLMRRVCEAACTAHRGQNHPGHASAPESSGQPEQTKLKARLRKHVKLAVG